MIENNKTTDFSDADMQKFNEGVLETLWTDNGIPYFVIKDGFDLKEYARLAKLSLERDREIAHDFTSKVVDETGTKEEPFDYKSKWFLEGLAEGEIE